MQCKNKIKNVGLVGGWNSLREYIYHRMHEVVRGGGGGSCMALADSTGRYKLELICSAEAEANVAPPGWPDSGSSGSIVAGRGGA